VPYGRQIDIDLIQYMLATKFGDHSTNNDCLSNFYVQQTHAPDSSEVKSKLATIDGLGTDANYSTLSKDSEYQLKETEYLLINYTDSKTDESGTEHKSVVNKYYGPGTIIRPNFALMDSSLYHNNHSYSKRDGFVFNEVTVPEGMFTLGVNEQIEIRDIINIDLDTEGSYIY
jgi:hypothetical protein